MKQWKITFRANLRAKDDFMIISAISKRKAKAIAKKKFRTANKGLKKICCDIRFRYISCQEIF